MASKVDLLTFDLHKPDGVTAYQAWLSANITGDAKILNIWYPEGLKVEIVVWDDGT